MPFVKCSVGGCDKKVQPILKVDPRDRDTWLYRECDKCFKTVCESHWSDIGGRVICDRCRKEMESRPPPTDLIDLGIRERAEGGDCDD